MLFKFVFIELISINNNKIEISIEEQYDDNKSEDSLIKDD